MDLEARRARLREHEPAVRSVAETPVYVFYEEDLRRNYRRLRSALDEHYPDSVVHFAVKANYEPAVLATLRAAGCHAEVYAAGELSAARTAGYEPDELLVTGMNRPPESIDRALSFGVERFLVDNATELERLIAAAERSETTPRLLVRGNPAMEVPTHPDVATATRETKFGLDIASGRAMAVAARAAESSAVELAGVQLHIGSQITGVEPYAVAAREMSAFAVDIRDELGVEIDVLDLGGGFPVPYQEAVPGVEEIVERLSGVVKAEFDTAGMSRPTLFLEPGRRLVGNAGTLLSTVGVVKETPHATFAVLDAGTNAVSSYWPYPIYALDEREPTETYHVAGPLCYSGDVLAEDVSLAPLEEGSTVAIDRIGAYSLGSSSNTNAMPKPTVVLLRDDGSVDVIRRRQSHEDVLAQSTIPDDL